MAQITQEVLTKIKGDEDIQYAIAKGMHRKMRTVREWVKDNDEILSSKAVVLIIKEETGLSEEQILEQEAEPVPATT